MQFNKYCGNQLLIILMKVILQNLQNKNFIQINLYSIHKRLNVLAFSLIELSIVLIIIGLLVAGVTGGASLIESAKRRALINEINNYKQAFLAFYAKNGRYPGDINNLGFVGLYSGQSYNNKSFPFPYDGTDTANNHYIPTTVSAPFVDMYFEGTMDFEPKGNKGTNPAIFPADVEEVPFSNVIKDMFIYYELMNDNAKDQKFSKYNSNNIQAVVLRYPNINNAKKSTDIPYIMKDIDKKLDDGQYNSGSIRSTCSGPNTEAYNSYDESIASKGTCTVNFFQIL